MPPTWSPLGPSTLLQVQKDLLPCAGRVDAIAVSSNFDGAGHSAMFLGTPGGGVWRSSTFQSGTPVWQALTDHLPGLSDAERINLNKVRTICVDPLNQQTVYAGSETSPTALLKSVDGGSNWSVAGRNLFGTASGMTRVLADPTGTLSVAFWSGGFWQSPDGGMTWTNVAPPALSTVEFHDAVYVTDANGQVTLYVAVVDPTGTNLSGIWSFASGTWTQMPMTLTNLKGQAFSRTVITSITMSSDRVGGAVASLAQHGDSVQKIDLLNLFTLNAGNWQPRWASQTEWFITQGGYVQAVGIASDGRLYGGGIGLAQSAGAQSFQNIETDAKGQRIHVDQHCILAYGSQVYVGNDGGIFRFTPRANGRAGVDQWESLNSPSLMNALSTSVSRHPTDSTVVLVGNQDNGVARLSGPAVWRHSDFSNERELVRFDYSAFSNGQYAYSADPNNGFYASQDAGVTLNGSAPNFAPAPEPLPFAIHPVDGRRLMVGWLNVFETKDRGQHWQALPSGQTFASALTYTTGKRIYIAAGAQLFQSDDDGASWWTVDFSFGSPILAICADSTNPDSIYLATAWNVFRRVNPSSAWERITGNLSLRINTMALLPKGITDPWLFVGTDAGVFLASTQKGNATSWVRYGVGLPDAAVQDLEIATANGRLSAATWGRGAWSVTINPVPPHVSIKIRKSNCGVFAVDGGTVVLDAFTFDLVAPLTYKWTATVPIVGSDNVDKVTVQAPPLGSPATVSVAVTDAGGAVVQDSVTFASMPQSTAHLIELLCSIRRFPNFPVDPLADPLRDFGVHPLSRPEIAALLDIRRHAATLSERTLEAFARRREPRAMPRPMPGAEKMHREEG